MVFQATLLAKIKAIASLSEKDREKLNAFVREEKNPMHLTALEGMLDDYLHDRAQIGFKVGDETFLNRAQKILQEGIRKAQKIEASEEKHEEEHEAENLLQQY